jgi:fucose 4-O-acetylase-like acetyltransferase
MVHETRSAELSKPISETVALEKRVAYVDIAKGIGIILVVMGHNDFALISPFAHKLIYSFHMPMFFFLSGMFFKPDLPFEMYVRHRMSRVLRPFLFMILFIYLASISFSNVGVAEASRRLVKAMYGNGHYLDWVQLWFLPHLFVVSLFAYFFFQSVHRSGLFQLRWVILAALYVGGVLGINLFWPFELNILGRGFTVFGLPFSLDLVFVSGFFFILGYELNKIRLDFLLESPFTLFVSGVTLLLLVLYFPPTIDFNTRLFESLPINTLEALLGILFILALSKQMERMSRLSSLFRYIGQASLIILVFQVPIQDYWGQKILRLTDNLQISYWLSFLVGVLGPIVINALFIRPNPIVRQWFSQSGPQENEQAAVSVFE